MKCSISGCSNIYEKKGQSISFHGFPQNPKILTAWVAATGTSNFIPTHRSKVCSDHFDEGDYLAYFGSRRHLKPEAVPTKLLSQDAARRISEYLDKERNSDPLTCILDMDAQMKQVALVRDSAPTAKSVSVSMHSQPAPLAPAPANTIKVVDMKKLLQPQPPVAVRQSSEAPVSNVPSVLRTILSTNSFKFNSKSESFVRRSGITTSQVLSCLRVILPGKFDLSRMIPNEKVALLVIRYLKLDEKNEEILKIVTEHLKIIIETVKVKGKKSVDFTKHPYTKISDRDLKRALAFILPENFSMIDITDELLALICISLNLDIYTDAYYILIKKIRKFTSEGQKFSEILNRGNTVYDASLEVDKEVKMNEVEGCATNKENCTGNEIECDGEQRRELVFVDVNNPSENSQEPVNEKPSQDSYLNDTAGSSCSTVESDGDLSSEVEEDMDDLKGYKRKKKSDVDSDWEPEEKIPIKPPEAPLPPYAKKLDTIVSYLHEKKCSAKDVLKDYKLMFDFCRHLRIRLRNSNVKLIESRLNYIIDNNISVNNVKDHLQQLKDNKSPPELTSNTRPQPVEIKHDKKLKMKPIVVIKDVLGFGSDQLLFMKKSRVKSNGFYKQISFSLKQNTSTSKYSTEEVRKLTDGSYKQFRRIVLKRNGTKGVFRVKYAQLKPGTVVYAKNFRHPAVGWVKGVVSKAVGRLRYEIKLDNSNVWCCTVDQLRPLLNRVVNNESQRSHRPIKPKQLFDL